MKFKKIFISISTIAPLSAALSFVSCNAADEGENIFTDVNTDQKLNIAKTTIETGINEFYQNAIKANPSNTTELSAIKDDIDSLATPLANFLTIIDSQNKKFLDFFYENNKSRLIPDVSLDKKQKYSKKTVQGSNRLVSFF